MNRTSFGKTSKGVEAFKYEITNSKGMKAELTDFGATMTRLKRMIMRIIFTVDPAERLNCFGQLKITQNV